MSADIYWSSDEGGGCYYYGGVSVYGDENAQKSHVSAQGKPDRFESSCVNIFFYESTWCETVQAFTSNETALSTYACADDDSVEDFNLEADRKLEDAKVSAKIGSDHPDSQYYVSTCVYDKILDTYTCEYDHPTIPNVEVNLERLDRIRRPKHLSETPVPLPWRTLAKTWIGISRNREAEIETLELLFDGAPAAIPNPDEVDQMDSSGGLWYSEDGRMDRYSYPLPPF